MDTSSPTIACNVINLAGAITFRIYLLQFLAHQRRPVITERHSHSRNLMERAGPSGTSLLIGATLYVYQLAVRFQGAINWSDTDESFIFDVDRVANIGGGTSGSLRLELWATRQPFKGGTFSGHLLGSYNFKEQLRPDEYYGNIRAEICPSLPADDEYFGALILTEYMGSKWKFAIL